MSADACLMECLFGVCQFFNLMVANPDQGLPEVCLYSLCR